jgi:2-oxoglutarate ferredoxin oxidoreductase subunit gamma
MIIKSFFAGFGGQGVLSMGYTLAYAGMLEDKHVTYLPVYGAEVRGGTAHCTVAIGDEEISSPVASEPEYVVVMNLPSMLKFQNQVASGGMFFLNTTLIEDRPIRGDLELVEIPATSLAEEIKNPRGANMIMLGAFVKKTELVALDSIHQALERIFAKKKKLIQVNRDALDRGFQLL